MSARDDHVKGDLRRRASRPYRFVSRLRDLVRESRGVRSHPSDSEKFLDFVVNIAEQTLLFLNKLLHEEVPTDEHVGVLRGKIADLEAAWTLLQQLVKPVVDADTLHVPQPVVSLVKRRAKEMLSNPAGDPVLAIEVLSELNFVQIRQVNLLEIEKQFREAMGLGSAITLPPSLGILGVPYSHGPALFMNSLLFHELGHYVFERWRDERVENMRTIDLRQRLLEKVEPAIRSHFPEIDNKDRLEAMFEFILPWWEEIFCDLFAVHMVGPVFTCVFWEYMNITGTIDAEKADLFHASHPSDRFRFGEQVFLLSKLDWSDVLSKSGIEVVETIRRDLEIAENCYEHKIPERPYDPQWLPAGFPDTPVRVFSDGLAVVRELVNEVMGEFAGKPEGDFGKEDKNIRLCLEHGIVPSALYRQKLDSSDRMITLINSAYFFQLSPMDKLFKIVKGVDSESIPIADDARLRQRVEEWTLKAISDILQHFQM